jgi:peptide/nickel transport system substrate-binding protein
LDGTVSRIDPATDAVTSTLPVGNGPGAIAAGLGGIWIASQYAGAIERIDPRTEIVTRTFRVGNQPQGIALAGGLVWVGARPAATAHRGGTLTVLAAGTADTFDPALANNIYQLLPLTYDGLTAYQRVGGSGSVQVVPDLAVSLPSPTDGGTTYTFQLRRGIRYSNGETVRPEDFRRALERDLILGNHPFANVIGAAACAARPSHCDLSAGVVTDDAANTVTFHLVAPNPEFFARLTFDDAFAVPAGTPDHDIGLHPMPATGAYEWNDVSRYAATLVRNPYFHEWSHAARPDGYPDRIVFRHIDSLESGLTAVERGTADYLWDGVPQDRLAEVKTRFAGRLYITPISQTVALILNTRVPPFTDVRVRQAISYAIDRAAIARLLGQSSQPACQILPIGFPGYRRYCPYTANPNPAGTWTAPDVRKAQQLIAASGTRGAPVTIWSLDAGSFAGLDPYLRTLFDRLGYPTHVVDFASSDVNAEARFADSRTTAQAALYYISVSYPSASQILQSGFGCQSFAPDSKLNTNWSEFCSNALDTQASRALQAETNNAPDTAALWAQADRTATNEAPAIPLTTSTDIHLLAARVGDYQYSFQQSVLLDQLWVR